LDPSRSRIPAEPSFRGLTWDGEVVRGHVSELRTQHQHPVGVHLGGTGRSRPSSSVHGILQLRRLEWVAMPFSNYDIRGEKCSRDRKTETQKEMDRDMKRDRQK